MTGGFPARYGGRLSSVLDVHSAEEVRSGLHGSAELSVLASTGALGGAFDGRQGDVDDRRPSHVRRQVRRSDQHATSCPTISATSRCTSRYAFTPTTKLVDHRVRRPRRARREHRDVRRFDDECERERRHLSTSIGAIAWSARSLSKLVVSRERQRVGALAAGRQHDARAARVAVAPSRRSLDLGAGSLTLRNRVADRRLAGSVTTHTARHERSFGYDVASYGIDYDASVAAVGRATVRSPSVARCPARLYFDDVWRVSPSWLIETGVRGEALSGRGWLGVSPRLSAKYFLTKDWAVTGAVGRFSQWTHSLAREDIPVRLFDFWVASDASRRSRARGTTSLGTERWLSPTRYSPRRGLLQAVRQSPRGKSAGRSEPSRRRVQSSSDGDSYGADVLLRQFERGPIQRLDLVHVRRAQRDWTTRDFDTSRATIAVTI